MNTLLKHLNPGEWFRLAPDAIAHMKTAVEQDGQVMTVSSIGHINMMAFDEPVICGSESGNPTANVTYADLADGDIFIFTTGDIFHGGALCMKTLVGAVNLEDGDAWATPKDEWTVKPLPKATIDTGETP